MRIFESPLLKRVDSWTENFKPVGGICDPFELRDRAYQWGGGGGSSHPSDNSSTGLFNKSSEAVTVKRER